MCPDYVLVPKSIAAAFRDALATIYDKMFPSGVLDPAINWGKIVNPPHFQRLKDMMDRTKGTILRGGAVDGQERIALTLYTNVRLDDALMEECVSGSHVDILEG